MKSNEIIAGSDDCLCASEKTAHIALNEKVRSAIGDEPKVCAIRDLRPPDLLIKINRIITIEILTSAGISGSEIEAWRVLAGPRHFVVMSDGSAEDDED